MKSTLYSSLALTLLASSLSYGIHSPRAEKIVVVHRPTEDEECMRDRAMLFGAAHLSGYGMGTLFKAMFASVTFLGATLTLTGSRLNSLGDIPTNMFLITLGCGVATYALHKLTNMFLRRSRKNFAIAFEPEAQYVQQ
ncbi:hypothetical protein JW872_01430 [Candidatus Babeliales bacterium]|nr:hypothetical protein [Candidatus Babeliales bacterium]